MKRIAQITNEIWIEADGNVFYFTSRNVMSPLLSDNAVDAVCEARAMVALVS